MYCNNCGSVIEEKDKFCENCGKPLMIKPGEEAEIKTGKNITKNETGSYHSEKKKSASQTLIHQW